MKLFLFAILLLTSFIASAVNSVVIKPVVEVSANRTIMLDDIIVAKNLSSADKKSLAKISIGNAPSQNESRYLESSMIKDLVKQAVKSKVTFRSPQRIMVIAKAPKFTKKTIAKELKRQWSMMCTDCQFRIHSVSLPLVPQSATIKRWNLESLRKLPKGTFAQKVYIDFSRGMGGAYWITGSAQVLKNVPVFKKSMSMGSRVNEGDVDYSYKDITFAIDSTPSKDDIIGKVLTRSVRAQDIIFHNLLKKEKALKRGDLVRVTVGDVHWQVSLKAIAQQDGYVGDYVKLKNVESNKLISGKVTGKAEVVIE